MLNASIAATSPIAVPAGPHAALAARGFSSIPIMPGLKKPGCRSSSGTWFDLRNWNEDPTAEKVASYDRWAAEDPQAGVGIRCGKLRGIDIDVLDNALADQVEAAARRILGDTRLVRIGRAPKRLLVYRTAAAASKIKSLFKLGDQDCALEILGAGQQFVAHGTHPTTRRPYEWSDLDIANARLVDVPLVTEAQLHELLAAFELLAAAAGAVRHVASPATGTAASSDPHDERGWVPHAMPLIPNNGVHYDTWINFGFAIKRSQLRCADTGFALFDDWSQKSSKYDPDITERTWDSLDVDSVREDTLGAGYIIRAARQHGFAGPPREHAAVSFDTLTASELADAERLKETAPRPASPAPRAIEAKAFRFSDPKLLPPRRHLYDKHFTRKYASSTAAPSGGSKTGSSLTEAVAMATGRSLFAGTQQASRPLRVWIWNGEDPREEIERRLLAIAKHYCLTNDDIGDRLLVNSGRDTPIIIAEKMGDTVKISVPLVQAMIDEIKSKQIDVLIIDPFVSSHGVPENDNGAIDRVVKTWAKIADETDCAVELIHHLRKPANGSHGDSSVDDMRGAVAMVGAVRSARIINAMSDQEAASAGIPAADRRRYFKISNGKANMKPPGEGEAWRKLVSVSLDNATAEDEQDWVGVVTEWQMPDAFDDVTSDDIALVQQKIAGGNWARDVQSKSWAGIAIASALSLDLDIEPQKARVKALLKGWIATKHLVIEDVPSGRQGRTVPHVKVGIQP